MSDRGTVPVIASRDNARVAAARRLRDRKHRERLGRFLIEGPRVLAEAIASSAPVLEVFYLWGEAVAAVDAVVAAAVDLGIPCAPVTATVIRALATTETPQGVVAVCRDVDVDLTSLRPGFVPVLVEVQDPGNVGTVLRSADAAGAAGAVLTVASVDLYNPKVVRSSAGSLFHLPVVRNVRPDDAIRALQRRGFRVLASATEGEMPVHRADMTGAVAVLFGNEAHGLPPDVVAIADGSIRIPIHGRAESLNLAAAATVVLFEAARQRETTS